jgi:hypothetical protein
MPEAASQSFGIMLSLDRMHFDEYAPSSIPDVRYQEKVLCPESTQCQRHHQFGPVPRVYKYLAQSSSTRQPGVNVVTRRNIVRSIFACRWQGETRARCRHRVERRAACAHRQVMTSRRRRIVSGPTVSDRIQSRGLMTREQARAIFRPDCEVTCYSRSSYSAPASHGAHVKPGSGRHRSRLTSVREPDFFS